MIDVSGAAQNTKKINTKRRGLTERHVLWFKLLTLSSVVYETQLVLAPGFSVLITINAVVLGTTRLKNGKYFYFFSHFLKPLP